VRAEESRGPQTALTGKMLTWLGCNDWTRVLDWVIKNPDDVFPRVFPLVAELGDKGDSVSCEILTGAAESLAQLAAELLNDASRRLQMSQTAKQLVDGRGRDRVLQAMRMKDLSCA